MREKNEWFSLQGSYIIHEAVEYCLKVDWDKLKMCVVNFRTLFKNEKEKNIANPVVMYGCESWTINKAEHWRTAAFELWFGEDSWESLALQEVQTSPS